MTLGKAENIFGKPFAECHACQRVHGKKKKLPAKALYQESVEKHMANTRIVLVTPLSPVTSLYHSTSISLVSSFHFPSTTCYKQIECKLIV
jgi:hypothetical protein